MDQTWIFGPVVCDLWHSVDVLASTSSILHLCVISLDRYWAITDPFNYPIKMSDKRAAYLILIVWVCSSSISFPAIAWWRLAADGENLTWSQWISLILSYSQALLQTGNVPSQTTSATWSSPARCLSTARWP